MKYVAGSMWHHRPAVLLVLTLAAWSITSGWIGAGEEPAPSVRLASVMLARQVRFGASLKDLSSETVMGLGFDLDPAALELRSITGFTLEEITTSSGESLQVLPEQAAFLDRMLYRWTQVVSRGKGHSPPARRRPPMRGQPGVDGAMMTHGSGQGGLTLRLTPPERSLDGLASVRGAVVVQVASGERQRLTLDPLAKWLNKTVQVKGIPAAFITVTREVEGQLSLTLSNDLALLFEDLYAYQADGKPIESRRLALNREPGRGGAVYQCQVPEDGKIDLIYIERVESVTIPFHFTDVPLPGPDFLPEPDAVIAPVPVDNGG